jgi:hypothetical protein
VIVSAKLADRSRVVQHRRANGKIAGNHDNGRPIEGSSYRASFKETAVDVEQRLESDERKLKQLRQQQASAAKRSPPWMLPPDVETIDDRKLSSQLSGCCYDYQAYSANNLCYIYGNDCSSGGDGGSHDSSDESCSQDGLSFIGISFSVNTASGNPYSYQLCDQFPMENIIDRDYDYVMSMDEDGWLVGGGYKTFDYSGKMP